MKSVLGELNFTPQDFSQEDFNLISLTDLEKDIQSLIIAIRTQTNGSYSKITQDIQALQSYVTLDENSDIQDLFNAYENIIKVSTDLRGLLKKYIDLEVYDSIYYAFYYKGKRYSAQELSQGWLTKGSKGQLYVDLEKACTQLQDTSPIVKKYQELFDIHYASYLSAIQGWYHEQNKSVLGTKGLNKGHIAQAYEEHIQHHHKTAYKFLNKTEFNLAEVGVVKLIIATQQKILESSEWHEDAETAWWHIRSSKGQLRGTAGGDSGRWQVKQAAYAYKGKATLKLSSLQNLKEGVRRYSAICDPDEPVEQVAREVAMYISESGQYILREMGADATNDLVRRMV